MASSEFKVEVVGAKELRSAFRSVGAKMGPELRTGLKAIATAVLGAVQGKVSRKSGAAAGSLGAQATTTGAGISWNKAAAPYYPWLDFGGSVGRGHQNGPWQGAIRSPETSSPWAGPPGSGRWLYPTVAEHRAETERMVDELIVKVAGDAGFEVH